MAEDDNGKLKTEKQEQPKEVVMVIRATIEGMKVTFPALADKVVTYGFLKLAEKTLDDYYAQQKSRIIQATNFANKNRFRNFLRRK